MSLQSTSDMNTLLTRIIRNVSIMPHFFFLFGNVHLLLGKNLITFITLQIQLWSVQFYETSRSSKKIIEIPPQITVTMREAKFCMWNSWITVSWDRSKWTSSERICYMNEASETRITWTTPTEIYFQFLKKMQYAHCG